MIISIMSSKGGVAKSTLCCNLYLYHKIKTRKSHQKVLLIDNDPQKSSYSFIKSTKDKTNFCEYVPNLKHYPFNPEGDYFIDLQGRDSQNIDIALSLTHIAIIPMNNDILTFNTLAGQLKAIEEAQKINKHLVVVFVFSRVSTQNKSLKNLAFYSVLRQLIEEGRNLFIADTMIKNRVDYANAFLLGKGAFQINEKAHQEISGLYQEIFTGENNE